MKKLILATLSTIVLLSSCKKEDTPADPIAEPSATTRIVFKQYYDGKEVTDSDFGTIKYKNAKGTNHSITKLQYLVSNITLHKTDGTDVNLSGYNLVDVSQPLSRYFNSETSIPLGSYYAVSMTFGFDGDDNIDGAYKDLNAASWSWPMMIGGGYHFMKFEGMFTDKTGSNIGFAYHNGTASKPVNGKRLFEENHFRVKLFDFNGGFMIEDEDDQTIEINMSIEEWFKNPIVWSLDDFHAMLMPNYMAQKMINQNGRSVFSLGRIRDTQF